MIPKVCNGQVVPVVGADLLGAPARNDPSSFYMLVARELLARYDLELPGPKDDWQVRADSALHDAACALLRLDPRRLGQLDVPVSEALTAVLKRHRSGAETAHRALAAISDFRYFVTTTPEDVLASAINAVRYGGRAATSEVLYAPSGLPGDSLTDIDRELRSDQAAVLYAFGKAQTLPLYAIHDEDTLEFIHALQERRGRWPERFLGEVSRRSLLLIGCRIPDWIARMLVRVAIADRLSGRVSTAFIVDRSSGQPSEFVNFMKLFSGNVMVMDAEPTAFAAELLERWKARKAADGPAPAADTPPPRPAGQPPAIFISYSRSDLDVVVRLYDQIRKIAGDDVAWFDKGRLLPGDAWRQQVEDAINSCSLFLPVISRMAEKRTDGEFLREWKLAVSRSQTIDGRTFVIPVCVDADASARTVGEYTRGQRFFGQSDFGFAPDGVLSDPLRDALRRELKRLRG